MSPGPLESDTCRDYVLPRLEDAGWQRGQILDQFPVTDGRLIKKQGRRPHRGEALWADYMLEYRPGVAIAVVEAKREYRKAGDGIQQAKNYAQMLDIPFAYSSNGKGVLEDDRDTGLEKEITTFPSPGELWKRYLAWKGIVDDSVATGLLLPFNRAVRTPDGKVKEPRYYQRVAIQRAIETIRRGDKRLLLTLATGTGKTFVSLQIVWKLWTSDWIKSHKPRVLYLADRRILIDQPITREYQPAFGDGPIWRLRGEAKAGREIYFALYQALGDSGEDAPGLFREFAPNFFDLVIVDECHRGSAAASSSWRAILEHFSSATQVGMTATPKREDSIDTYEYFGDPIYTYSLAQGIADGFLAPYTVKRVVLSPDAHGWEPEPGQLDRFGREIPKNLYKTKDFERVVSLLSRTEAAANHLTAHLKKHGRMAKTIVFCVDREHADQMRRALHNANTDLTKQYPNYVVRIVADDDEHLGAFADTEKEVPVIATTSQLLSTGVDLPTVRNIVLFRPIGSIGLFKQIIGRGTRLFPDEDKLSFDIIDYSGATALFSDPEFDGPPERVEREEVDENGEVKTATVVEENEPPFEDDTNELGPDDVAPREKFYVDGTEVIVTAEAVYELDPVTDRLRLVEYRDLVGGTVRALFADPASLRTKWASREGRRAVIDSLRGRGVHEDELADRAGLPASDVLDILVHIAWNEALATRADRVRRVRTDHADFLQSFKPEAREVLDDLLEKYSEYGVSELDDLKVLQVPPLAELGSPVEIAHRFGGRQGLEQAVAELQRLLYAA
jgi:type I restriction enzyme, R subunit